MLHINDFLGVYKVHKVVLVELLRLDLTRLTIAAALTNYIKFQLLVNCAPLRSWPTFGINIFLFQVLIETEMNKFQHILHKFSCIGFLVEVVFLWVLSGVIELEEFSP